MSENQSAKLSRRAVFLPIGLVILVIVLLAAALSLRSDQIQQLPYGLQIPAKTDTLDQLRQIEIQLIRLDLNEYSGLSTAIKDEIANSILEAARKYNLPPALMHAIFQIESDYRFNIDHPTVTVKHKGKRVKTNARGLGGIVWLFWEEKLIAEGICETSSDLYIPKKNVMATGYILRQIINSELAKDRNGWIVRRIITQYYGVQSPVYEARMRQVTSNLWLKRIAREIEQSGQVSDSNKRTE